jgi:hypothetical protein
MMAAAVAGRDSSLSEESVSEQEDSFRSDHKKLKKKKPIDKFDDRLMSVNAKLCFLFQIVFPLRFRIFPFEDFFTFTKIE